MFPFSPIIRIVFLCLVLAFLGLVPIPLPASLSNNLLHDMETNIGLAIKSHVKIKLYILPTPQVWLDDVEISDAEGERVLTAQSIRAALKIVPLLHQRLKFSDIVIDHAQTGSRAFWFLPRAQTMALLGLRSLTLQNSRIDTPFKPLFDVNARLSWSGHEAPLYLVAGFSVLDAHRRETRLSFEQRLTNPGALLGKGQSFGRMLVRADSFSLSFSGDYAVLPDWQMKGDGALTIADSAEFARLLGAPADLDAASAAPGQTLALWLYNHAERPQFLPHMPNMMDLHASLNLSRLGLSLEHARLVLDRQTLTGSAQFFAPKERTHPQHLPFDFWTLSATLDTDYFDADAFGAFLRAQDASVLSGGHNSGFSLSPGLEGWRSFASALPDVVLDLRLSSQKFRLLGKEGQNLALSYYKMHTANHIKLAQASYLGGAFRGDFAFDQGTPLMLEATLTAKDFDFGAGITALTGYGNFEASAQNLALSLKAQAPTLTDLARTLAGTITITLGRGTVQGFSAEAVLRAQERLQNPTAGWQNEKTNTGVFQGRTVFDTGTLSATLTQGRLEPIAVSLSAPAMGIAAKGAINLAEETLAVTGTVDNTGLMAKPANGAQKEAPSSTFSPATPFQSGKFEIKGALSHLQGEILPP